MARQTLSAKITRRTLFPTGTTTREWFDAGTVIKVYEGSFSSGYATASVPGVPYSRTRIPVDRIDPNA